MFPAFTFKLYDSYYYDNGESPARLDDTDSPPYHHCTLLHSPRTIRPDQDLGSEDVPAMLGMAQDINSDVLYEGMTRSALSSSPQPPSPQLRARGPSPSNELSPLWHGRDNAHLRSPFFTPVLPASDLQATVSPSAIFGPPSDSDSDCPDSDSELEDVEGSLPSPVPSYRSRPTKASGPPSFPSPPPLASSSRILTQPPTTASAPLNTQSTTPSLKRRATGKVKGKDAIVGTFPQGLIAKLEASSAHHDKVISKAIERQGGHYWFVTFVDGSKCCVCNLPEPCNRVCSNSRGINRHFRAAPHFLGQRLGCNHPTHPCGASFLRQDVLTRHLATPHPAEKHKGKEKDTSGKQSTVKSSRVARGKPY